MPCVEGELCHVPATSPKPTEAHGCQEGCGGRLHGTCGSIADDNEMHRICSHCLAKTKLIYGKELLDVKVSTMLVADTLRAQAKERKMKAGTAGLAEGHYPHVRDAAELLKKAWTSVTAQDIVRSGSNTCCSCSCKYSDRAGRHVAWRKTFVSDSTHFSPCCFAKPKNSCLLYAMICSSPLLR